MLLALALAAQSFTYSVTRPLEPSAARPAQESRQGWLGVGLDIEEGADRPLSASEIAEGSPAGRAGLQVGDRLIALEGQALESYDGLIELLREYGPGREVSLTLRRELAVELDRRGWGEDGGPRLGVHLGQLDADDEGGARWVVNQVEAGWPAASAGVQAGDRIVGLGGCQPADFDELQKVLAEVAPQDELELVIERDLKLSLGERPGGAAAPAPFGGRYEPSAGGRLEAVPDGEGRLRLQPSETRAGTADLERQLREEITGLNQELRALREELRTLRRELAELRAR